MAAGSIDLMPASIVTADSLVDYARDILDRADMLGHGSGQRSDQRSGQRRAAALPGLDIDILSFDPDISGAIDSNLVRVEQPDNLDRRQQMRAFVVHADIPGAPLPATWSPAEPFNANEMSKRLEAAGLQASYFWDLGHWHISDPSAGVAVQLMRAAGEFPPWETGAPLRLFLHWHYAKRGLRLTHGGTLAINGRGVLLAGAGGSGKSGTVIAGLLNGLQSVGDDYVLLGADPQVSAYPLFGTLKQDPAGFRRLGLDERLTSASALNWQGKHQFHMDDVAAGPPPPRLDICAMFLPRVTGEARTVIEEAPRSEALIALAATSIYQMPGERESGFRFFSAVTRQLPCYRLLLGTDPREVTDTIGDFIEGRRP